MLWRMWVLVVKEMLAIWRDKKSRAMLLVPPMVQLVVFTFAATQEVKNVSIGVLNQDWGHYSRELVARFAGSRTFVEIHGLRGVAEIAPLMDAQKALLVLHIGPTFSADIAAGRPAPIQAILDGRRSNAAQIVQGYATSIVDQFNRDIAGALGRAPPATAIVARAWFNPNLDSVWNIVPSLVAVITMVIGLSVTALSIARERELGTFEQLLVSPLQPIEILVGKTVPALIIGMAEGSLIMAVGVLLFGVPLRGSLLLLYAAMPFYLAAVIGVGLFISSLVATQQQAILGTFVFMSPAMLLSGFSAPIENMPSWLQTVTLADPARWFLVIVKGVFLKDMPAADVFANVWPMALIALGTLAAATWLFRRRLE